MRISLPEPNTFAALFRESTGLELPTPPTGIATDNREVIAGDLFVAIKGEQVDGHSFIPEAETSGAVAVLVEKHNPHTQVTELITENPVKTIGTVAKAWRDRFPIPILGITGSNGKTTTKEIIRHLLSPDLNVHATEGNYNTSIGLPLTLLTLTSDHQVSILEMGANQPGDIRYLCTIARPTHGIITNIAPAHLAGFGSVSAIAQEKGELFQALHNGTAYKNCDDSRIAALPCPATVTTYGFQPDCDFAADLWTDQDSTVALTVNTRDIYTHSRNITFAKNVLAAMPFVINMGVKWDQISQRLERFQPAQGRSVVRQIGDTIIIDDTYNANLNSTRAAIDFLTSFKGKRQILVFGDMLELGVQSAEMHAAVGTYASEMGVTAVYTTGTETVSTDQALSGSLQHRHTATKAELLPLIKNEMKDNTVILFKGSRGMAMETLIHQLEEAS